MAAPDFRPAVATLFRECFEGIPEGHDYTWFVQGSEGIFDALRTVSPARASMKPNPDCPSIAAHVIHVLYALRSTNSFGGRPEPEGTWETSWEKQTVDDEEWTSLNRQVREEYEFFLDMFTKNEDWSDPDSAVAALAPLPHMAFHLGAIRALMKVV